MEDVLQHHIWARVRSDGRLTNWTSQGVTRHALMLVSTAHPTVGKEGELTSVL